MSFAENNHLKLFETSALKDENIQEAFECLILSKPKIMEKSKNSFKFKPPLSSLENTKKLSKLFLELNEGQPKYLRFINEDVSSLSWRQHKKHIFILTDAGKPIFSRYGKEDDLSPMMGLLMAVVSFIIDDNDSIRTIYTGGDHKIVFVVKGPVYFACVSSTNETESELKNQLELLYTQIIFILTERIIDHLKKKASFDLRNLLGGTDNVLHSLIHAMSCDVAYTFSSFKTLRLPKSIRYSIGDALVKNIPDKSLFSILVADNQIVHLGRSKKYGALQPLDLLLLLNFINSNSAIRSSETWTPLCLPGFSPEGFLYAYIHFFPKTDIGLIVISLSQNSFFDCSNYKASVETKLTDLKIFPKISEAVDEMGINPKEIKVPEVRHFIYRNAVGDQYLSSDFIPPYNSKKEKKRLIRNYKMIRDKLLKNQGNIKQYLLTNEKETIFVSITNLEEMYVTFPLTTSKNLAIECCDLIKKYIQKEEETLFISQVQW
jgi:vacuolar fusion protein MON1